MSQSVCVQNTVFNNASEQYCVFFSPGCQRDCGLDKNNGKHRRDVRSADDTQQQVYCVEYGHY